MGTSVAETLGVAVATFVLGADSDGSGEPRELTQLVLNAPDLQDARGYVRASAAAAFGFPLSVEQTAIVKDFETRHQPLEVSYASDAAVFCRRALRASKIKEHREVVALAAHGRDMGISDAEWKQLQVDLGVNAKMPSVETNRRIASRLGAATVDKALYRLNRARHAESEIRRLEDLDAADLTSLEREELTEAERAAAVERLAALAREAEQRMAEIEAARTTAGNAEAALRRVQEQMAKS